MDKERNIYKILFWILVPVFMIDAIVRFGFKGVEINLLGSIEWDVWLTIITAVLATFSTIAILCEAKKGKIIGFSNNSLKTYPYFKIILYSCLIAFLYSFITMYCRTFVQLIFHFKDISFVWKSALQCVFWFYDIMIIAFLTVFVYVFVILTIAWYIAKKKREKQLSKE